MIPFIRSSTVGKTSTVKSDQWMSGVGLGETDCNGQQENLGRVREMFYILTADMITQV